MPFLHQFNNLSGRLTESTRLQPLYPLDPVPLAKAQPPPPMYEFVKTAIQKTMSPGVAHMSSHGPGPGDKIIYPGQETLPEHIKKKYIKYQTNIHEPVYLKGGMKDRVLFGITLVGTAYGLFESFRFMWEFRNSK